MSNHTPPTSSPSDREIVSTRDFTLPPEKVFAAFRDPARLAKWWGPAGFSNVIDTFDLRVGGKWLITMIAPDGARYPNESSFIEVSPPGRIVFQHEEPVHRFRMTMTFESHGTGTTLTWRMQFETAEEAARVRGFIEVANQQNFDRLQAELASHP